MKVKGYRQSRKCARYINQMIGRKIWKVNEKIPSIVNISKAIGVSYPTVRNVIRQYEQKNILENYGSMGFFLKAGKGMNTSQSLVSSLKTNLEAVQMFKSGAIQIQNWIVQLNREKSRITGLNVVSGQRLSCLMSIVQEIIESPIKLEHLLEIQDENKMKIKKKQYDKQCKFLPLAKIVIHHKKELKLS